MSYSQNGEEDIILEFFGDYTGRFLDIGAFDGKTFSNTLALAERGWSGLLVEPAAQAFRALRSLHGGNPRLILVNALVGTGEGEKFARFWESDDAVSTANQEHFEKWEKAGQYHPPTYMPTVMLFGLLSEFFKLDGRVDFVSIDTEGNSVEILKSYPFGVTEWPKLFCVEYDFRADECGEWLASRGYQEIGKTSENVLLARIP